MPHAPDSHPRRRARRGARTSPYLATVARPIAAAAIAAGATLSLAACAAPGVPDEKAKVDPAQAAVDFAKCMRQHGVDMPDPVDGKIQIKSDPSTQAAVEAGQKACQKFLKQAEDSISPAEKAKRRAAVLKFAQCMRQHGVDVPDPDENGGIKLTSRAGSAESKTQEKASTACASTMGEDGPKLGPPPGGSGAPAGGAGGSVSVAP
jgi:hypothetical protein